MHHARSGVQCGAGGCTTTYEALAVGTPVVSWPGSALRGRFTKALLERAGLRQCVVASAEALAVTSVQVRPPLVCRVRLALTSGACW